MRDDVDGGHVARIAGDVTDEEVRRLAIASPAKLDGDGHRDGTRSGAHVPDQVGLRRRRRARSAGEVPADTLERQAYQRLGLGTRDEHAAVDGDGRAVELLHAADVGHRLARLASRQVGLVAVQLAGAEDGLGVRRQRAAIDTEDVCRAVALRRDARSRSRRPRAGSWPRRAARRRAADGSPWSDRVDPRPRPRAAPPSRPAAPPGRR